MRVDMSPDAVTQRLRTVDELWQLSSKLKNATRISWRELVDEGCFELAEALMLAETDRGEGFFPENEIRASFYENWGDTLDGVEQVDKYKTALMNWGQWASCSTSGGEGTARMLEVNRVEEKIRSRDV
jgi:hypothetical protein